VVALVAAAVGIGVFVLGPTGELPTRAVDATSAALDGLGLPGWATANALWEFLYNVLLFVPVALVGALLWRQVRLRVWTALGFAASLLIETLQAVVLTGRTPQVSDLVANTLGAFVGAALGRVAWRLLRRG
jgi:glycopeptide antibiotics resistance protein